ncbi:MAG TPA: M20/M25/M40 family metallo-hydrolase [Phycisphaerae bacterium]|nr:M20/M25/M40 family metallo-hydrolase [Phycisphaerae bacterium]
MPEKLLDDAVALTRRLVRLDSQNAANQACEDGVCECLARYFAEQGLACVRQEAAGGRRNLLVSPEAAACRSKGSAAAPRMLIIGHMDTVVVGAMKDPLGGQLREGRIFGRGACDDKGPLAAAAATVAVFARSGAAGAWNLTFAATADEEGGMRGARALARTIGSFDLCIALEPTRGRVVTAHKGVCRAVLVTRGRAGHSSQPDKGPNAIEAMLPLCTALMEYSRELSAVEDARLGRSTLTMTQFHAGAAPNVIPDRCELVVDIRLLPECEPAEIERRLRGICGQSAQLHSLLSCRGIRSDPEGPVIRAFRQAVADEGGDATPMAVHYCTDCSQLAHLGPCAVWGPGDIAQAHGDEEFIEVAQIESACRTLWRFLHG